MMTHLTLSFPEVIDMEDNQRGSSSSRSWHGKYRKRGGFQNRRGRRHHSSNTPWNGPWNGPVSVQAGQNEHSHYNGSSPKQEASSSENDIVHNTNENNINQSPEPAVSNSSSVSQSSTQGKSESLNRDSNRKSTRKARDLPVADCLILEAEHKEKGSYQSSQRDLNASLFEFCKMGRKFLIQKLVRAGADVSARGGKSNSTALHVAVEQGFVDIADFLLIKGADVNAVDTDRNTPLILAVNPAGSTDMLNLLLSYRAKVHYHNSQGMTALMKAAEVMDIDALRILMFAGADLNLRNRQGKTARDIALQFGIADVFDALKCELQEEKRTRYHNPKNPSALTKAMLENHTEAVEILLDSRINSKIKEKPIPLYKQAKEETRNCTLKELVKSMCSAAEENKKPNKKKLEIAKILLANVDPSEKGTRPDLSSALIDATRCGIFELVKIISGSPDIKLDTVCSARTALMVAAEKGHAGILSLLLVDGADPRVTNKKGERALTFALNKSQIDCAQILLHRYKPSEEELQKMATMIVKEGQVKSLQFLASHCDLEGMSQSLMKPAVLSASVDTVRFLIDHGAEINGPCDGEKPALLVAVGGKDDRKMMNMVKFLVENGACVNRSPPLDSPLVSAIEHNVNSDMLRYLLEHGADVNEVGNDEGNAPLTAAFNVFAPLSGIRHSDMIEVLLEAGADPNQPRGTGDTALHLAVREGNVGIIKQLIDAGADLEAQNVIEMTPLLVAAQRGQPDVIRLLKRCGANMKAVDPHGRNALMRLLETSGSPQEECVRLLAYDKDQANLQAPDGLTPLILAATTSNHNVVKILLELGADPHMVDNTNCDKRTVLSILLDTIQVRHNAMPVVKELIQRGALASLPKRCVIPLFHMIMCNQREIVQLIVTHGMAPVCVDFVGAGAPSFGSFMLGISNTVGRNLSPLSAALVRNRLAIARYLVGNWFLTPADVVGCDQLNDLRAVLQATSRSQSQSFLEEYMSQPMSLVQLSFVAVSSQLGEMAGREERVRKTPLPPILQDKLLFKRENVAMDFTEEEESVNGDIFSDEDSDNDSMTSGYTDFYNGSDVYVDPDFLDYEDGFIF